MDMSESAGHPAPDSKPDRRVEITAHDDMTFDPPGIHAEAGETIEFLVTNNGKIAHSWSLGTSDGQMAHEREMAALSMSAMASHMEGAPNGFVLQPGETRSLVWQFGENGSVEYACHMPGHFAAGMVGEVQVDTAMHMDGGVHTDSHHGEGGHHAGEAMHDRDDH